MNKYLVISIVILFSDLISAQDANVKAFVPNGDPIVRIFANVHSGLTQTDPSKAFEVRRAYLGYKYRLSEHFSTEIKVDIGSPEEISEDARLRRYAYFKTAALYWEKEKWTIRGGIYKLVSSDYIFEGLAPYPDDWFDDVRYQGAFGTFNWASGWTLLSQEGILVD